MRIAQIVPSLDARHGGPSRSVRGLASALARAGHAVDLLTTGEAALESDAVANLSLQTFPRDRPALVGRSVALHQRLLSARHDIVHHHALWLRTLHHARDAAEKNGAPLVISPRGMMSEWAWNHHRWRKQLASLLIHPRAFSAASGWHATSEAEADDIRRLGFNQPICVSPNAVTSPAPDVVQAEAAHWLALRPVLRDRRVALFYSRFHSKKRVLELLDLWQAKDRGDWLLLLVGIPEQYTVEQLDRYVAQGHARARVLVHDGSGHPPPYAAASLFLLPSHSENFGLVVAEALVRGVPSLVTDTTPWQAMDARGLGRCVPWEQYGAALDDLLAKPPETLAAMGGGASAWARAEFSWEKSASILADFYTRLSPAK